MHRQLTFRRRRGLPDRRSQRGAAALFAAIGMLGMLAATAFAIDLAQMYVAQRQLQNMANLAALDVARAAGGCLAPDANRQAVANQTAVATIGRLGGEGEWLEGNNVTLGQARLDANRLRVFQPVAADSAGEAFAFKLQLQRPMPRMIMPFFNAEGLPMSATAAAVMAPSASYRVASFGAAIDPNEQSLLNNLLSQVLGSPLSLSVISYQGLLASSVEVLDVADELAGTTVEELLGEPILLPGLLTAVADALFAAGDTVAADAFDTVAAVAPNDSVILGDLIGSPSDTIVGLGQATLNTLDLLQGLALQLGGPALSLTPNLEIPPLTTGFVEVELGNPPSTGAGPALQDSAANFLTTATNSQGRIAADVGLPLLGQLANIKLELDIAEAQADLMQIHCAGRGRDQHQVDVGVQTTLARLRINNPPSQPLLNLLGLVQVCWEGEVELGQDAYQVLNFTGPFNSEDPELQSVGSSVGATLSSAVSDLLITSPPQLCGGLGGLNTVLFLLGLGNPDSLMGALVGELLPLLTGGLDAGLLDPLLGALGVRIGGAEVGVSSVYMPPPALIETR